MKRRRRIVADRAVVDAFRRALAAERTLFEVRDTGGTVDWQAVTGEAPFDWDAAQPLSGAKRFLLPSREPMLAWHGEDVRATLPAVAPFALFGVRACDLAAVTVLDRVMGDDPWYRRRRDAALLVGVACLAACPTGFCIDVDAGPFPHAGADLSLVPLPDGRVLLDVASERGRDALARAAITTAAADAPALAAHDRAETDARATFATRPYVAHAIARVDAHAVEDAEWGALGPSCFACTGCTSVCPTCACFTIVDQACDGDGVRVRHLDSCLLEGFQREASGNHPAPRAADRVRRYWSHKLSHEFVPALGRIGCVGCGRCDVTCPGGIGATAVLGALGSR